MVTKSDNIDCLFVHTPQIIANQENICGFYINIIAMGIFSMSNILHDNGMNPKIIHLGVEKYKNIDFDIAQYIKKNNIRFVGLSLHWHYQTYDTLAVARQIKEINPNTYIFLGGIMSSAFAEDILNEYPQINAVIKGEGEKSIAEFAKRINNDNFDLSDIPNLYWRDKENNIRKNKEVWFASEEELNTYSFDGLEFLENYETYLKFPMQIGFQQSLKKFNNLNSVSVLVSCLGRGCPGNCTWCGGGFNAMKKITGRDKIVLRDPQIVADEFVNMKKKYNIDVFYVCFDPYPNNQEYLVKLFEILGKEMPRKIRISFECFGLPTKEFVDAFSKNLDKKSVIMISPELGDEQMRFRHKSFSFTNNQLVNCVNYIMSKKIPLELFFTEIPIEDQRSKNATRNMILSLMPVCRKNNITVHHQPIKDVEPFSPWAMNPEKYNFVPNLIELKDYVENSKKNRNK